MINQGSNDHINKRRRYIRTAAQRATASNRAWKRGNTSKVNIQQQGIQEGDTDDITEKMRKMAP